MFVVYQWEQYEGEWGHKYFHSKENAEEYARQLREEDEQWGHVELEEIQTED